MATHWRRRIRLRRHDVRDLLFWLVLGGVALACAEAMARIGPIHLPSALHRP